MRNIFLKAKQLGFFVPILALIAVFSAYPASAKAENINPYMVIFKDNIQSSQVAAVARELGIQSKFTYRSIFRGFSADLNESQIQALSRNPQINYLERDGEVSISETQLSATWGIDRIDQRTLPRSGSYVYGSKGQNVRSYVVDTGVLSTHQEFTGRMLAGYTAISDGRGTTDCNGHGTHVAGTISGTTYGVAKKSLVVPVRVLDCRGSGSWSGVVAGLDWITANHPSGTAGVANMSLGGVSNTTIDNAVTRLVNAGVTVVVAAGNSTQDACNFSPARAASAITVAASTSADALADYSNFGSCVDIIAPGSSITSAWYTGTSAISTISGTSMASPHVAGAAALLLEAGNATPSVITSSLIANSTLNRITLSSAASTAGTLNRLLYTNPQYTVTFFNNDGTSNSTSQTVSAGQPLTLPTVTRTNFTFNGWYTDASAGTKVGIAGGSYTPTSSTNLYAQWTADANPQYTVTFFNNDGTSNSTSQTVVAGEALTLPTVTRTNFTLNGWYTDASAGTKVGIAGGSYTPTSSTNLYAQWTADANPQYTVTFFNNDGTSNSTSQTVVAGEALTLPTVTRTNFTLNGWYTDASAGTKEGNAGGTYTPTSSTNLYAQWTADANPQYTVTFFNNDGTSNSTSQTVVAGEALTLPTVTRTNFTLNGWYTDSSAGTKEGNAGGTYTPTSSTNLYAQWTAQVVPGAPSVVTASPSSTQSRAIFVQWQIPSNDGGSSILQYEARAFAKSKGGAPVSRCIVASTSLNCDILNLRSGTTYFVEVVAINAIGISPASSPRVQVRAS